MTVVYAPSTLLRGAKATFTKEADIARGQLIVDEIAERVTSDGDKEIYPWLGEAPRMQLFKDELQYAGLSDTNYTLTNDIYSIALAIKRKDLEDDQIGAIMKRVRAMARVATLFPNRLIINALIAGTSGTGYDGNAFFSDTHPDRGAGAAQDNLLAGTGTSTAQISTDLGTAIGALSGMTAENGEPLNEMPTKFRVVAPFAIRKPMLEAIGSNIISNTTNVQFSGLDIKPLFSARLTDANDWYLLCTDGFPAMPLIYQERDPVTTETLDAGTDTWVKKEEVVFKVRWRGVVGYGHWGTAVKVVNS